MKLPDILKKLDSGAYSELETARALAKHLDPFLLATALIEVRRQRNNWRDLYNERQETPL